MEKQQGIFERFALRISDWSEKWFPDSYIFALLGVIIVSVAALGIGAPIHDVATSFGNGFWSLIPFTLQMTMLIIVGYVVSVSIVKLLYYSYKIRKKLEITHRLSRST
ncbi:TIGR00366 family protein, partial [Acinetobacter baumannii]